MKRVSLGIHLLIATTANPLLSQAVMAARTPTGVRVAQASAHSCRVLVVAPESWLGPIATHVRGQLIDLNTRVSFDVAQSQELQALRNDARQNQVDVLLLVGACATQQGLCLSVSELSTGASDQRYVGDTIGRSATGLSVLWERIALYTRSAVMHWQRAMEAVARRRARRQPKPVRPRKVKRSAAIKKRKSIPATPLDSSLLVGWDVAIDGQTSAGQHGIRLQFAIGRGSWAVGADLRLGLPLAISDSFTRVRLSRQGLRLFAGLRSRLGARVQLEGRLALGAALMTRSSEALSGQVRASDSSLHVSTSARCALLIGVDIPRWERAQLVGTAAIDYLPRAPTLTYGGDGTTAARQRALLRWQPNAMLGLRLRLD